MADYGSDKKSRDNQMRSAINQQLVETGEREKLKELLRVRLAECGWRDQLKQLCKEIVRERGLEHVSVDDLVQDITPKARQLVPDTVKKELLQKIRNFLAQQANV
ncbi:transcription and mRNA export factor ENY2 [Ciona intestinalis]|uniref:Transcription and mRNA export factor ENY2 n=1 Tax=Ciona intestinalis TaxID=7719 RepID=ENY2_CIOIN|nr:transcription and mRNA export factor ENY2 [Ciona intestinalis]Q4H3N8.1 RecName: Full=Transcription and mRNA export factor ENY2; AltName: Full=Enhancer of yellow 2 transcription factor homolog [Ciona intestinalis]BAE06389.1 Ci-E(Y)2 [Ciona intestinalis]|eukprot:NP_001071686.1 transcription and mRNA export factor ENY2 [Ciona intestinalis]